MAKLSLILLAVVAGIAVAKAAENDPQAFLNIFNARHKEPGPQAKARANVVTSYIEQKLDHFDDKETRTWQMRYMANDEFYQEGGPIFIYVGGEWAISAGSISGGHVYDMAREHNGYLFYTEHRFYGQSRPVSAMTNENMKYLNVRQALADLAHFIRTMKATIPGMSNSKAILTGGSYSATMVIWFKKLYPDLAAGCWASSAPLFAKANFFEYKEVMGESVTLVGGQTCHDRIKRGIAELESMIENKRGAEVKAMLRLCNNFDEHSDLDVWTLFYEISEIFANLVQTHNHYSGSIQNACNEIMAGSTDLIGVSNYIVKNFGTKGCTDMSYKTYVGLIIDSAFSNNIMRQWIYQTCNEFGWYQTSTSTNQPFGSKYPLVFFTTMCADAYGQEFTNEFIQQQLDNTNAMFGGLNPEVENVYMSHGQVDPWRAMGIQDENQATIIPYHAHCKDLGSISDNDTPELRASKEKVAQLVREWLSE
ncbi:putative serine protease K12H4.7 isoform X1 [Musca domestica]|uniref:Serine protease K12H4.7 isoform X1 n=1 Tax=Musca domestica TaxID=7370 RepID=A0ABM3V0B2_MUSDO|nr:putative serine protease K12H4.7 isoform X1 [Musca domestica]